MAGSSGKPLQRGVCNARRRCSFFTGRANNWQNISATQRQGEAAVHFSRQVFSPGQRFNRRRSLITGRKCPQNSPPPLPRLHRKIFPFHKTLFIHSNKNESIQLIHVRRGGLRDKAVRDANEHRHLAPPEKRHQRHLRVFFKFRQNFFPQKCSRPENK